MALASTLTKIKPSGFVDATKVFGSWRLEIQSRPQDTPGNHRSKGRNTLPLTVSRLYDRPVFGWVSMRFLLGLIVGAALTIVAVYVLDMRATREAEHIVNWDVAGEKLGVLTAEAREVWADFTREITGPQ